jgi:O-antigen/teichoic acid export membrane protein
VCDDLPMASQAPAAAPGPTSRSLTSDVGLTFASKVAVVLFQVAGTVLVARRLGPAGRGTVAVASALVLVCQQLGSLGLATANPYFGLRDRSSLKRILANSIAFSAIVGVTLGGLSVLAKLLVPATVRGLSWADVGIVAAAIPAALLFLYLQGILLGEGRMLAYNLVEAGQNLVSLLALAVGLYVLGIGVTGSIAVLVGVYYLGAGVYLQLLRTRVGRVGRVDLTLARRMLHYAFRVYVASFIAFLIIRLDLFLVNGYLGAHQAGLYSIAAGLADAMFVLPMVIGLNVFPRIAGGGTAQTSATVFRLVALVYGLMVLVSALLAGPAIRLLYGPAFAGSTSLYYWLAPGVLSLGLVTVLSQHFAGRGFPLQAMVVWFVGLAVNLGINLLFLPRYGTHIAALSSSVAYTLLLALHVRLFADEIGGPRELVPRPSEMVALGQALLRRATQ